MEVLERIRKVTGAQAALGLSLEGRGEQYALPENCRKIASTGSVQFCRIDGYLDTVFAVRPDKGFTAVPLAYCLQDFICLVLSCGCAQAAAEGVVLKSKREKMEKLAHILKLKPMSDPLGYIKTVNQVIDYSKISMKRSA